MNKDLKYNIRFLSKLHNSLILNVILPIKHICCEYLSQTINKLITRKIEVTDDIYNEFVRILLSEADKIEKRISYDYFDIVLKICKTLDIQINKQLIELIISMLPRQKQLQKILVEYFNIFNDVKLTNEQKRILLTYAIDNYKQQCKQFIINNSDILIENDIINIVKYDIFDIYKILVEEKNIIPNLRHLIVACSSAHMSCELIEYIVVHKVTPNIECLRGLFRRKLYIDDKRRQKILNVFLDIGIPLQKEDIKMIIRGKCDITNDSYYKIIDDEIYDLCVEHKYFLTIMSKYKQNNKLISNKFSNMPKKLKFTTK
jgi:hypothetical protein